MIYLDHAAATPVDPAVLEAMMPYFSDRFGNPSSLHMPGQKAREAVDAARRTCARLIGASSPREIVFTSGGTESNNLAIFGVALSKNYQLKTTNSHPHLITTAIEHESVLEPMKALEKRGFRVTYLPVTREGVVKLDALKKALTPETILVSIMAANNEVGTIQPVAEVAHIIAEFKKSHPTPPSAPFPLLHTDACQAAGVIDLPELIAAGVDLLTQNGGKIYGPKGIGLLYAHEKTPITPLFYGGGQEHKRRSGTENVPAIAGLAKALELATIHREKESARLAELRNRLWEGLQKNIPNLILNGPPCSPYQLKTKNYRLANNLSFIIKGIEGEILLMRLDCAGICASAGSACTAGSTEPSHVLRAMGISRQDAYSAVRFSLGRSTTSEQIEEVIAVFTEIVGELKSQSGR